MLPNQTVPQPQAPNPEYDFIFQNGQQPKSKLSLPSGKGPYVIAGAIGLGLVVGIILISTLIFGGKKDVSTEVVSLISQQNEIARYSQLASSRAIDPDTRALAATTSAVLSSDSTSLKNYLNKTKQKVDTKKTISLEKKSNDSKLDEADQLNHYNDAYLALLKANLSRYQRSLKSSYELAGPKGKAILQQAFLNTKVISKYQLLTPPATP